MYFPISNAITPNDGDFSKALENKVLKALEDFNETCTTYFEKSLEDVCKEDEAHVYASIFYSEKHDIFELLFEMPTWHDNLSGNVCRSFGDDLEGLRNYLRTCNKNKALVRSVRYMSAEHLNCVSDYKELDCEDFLRQDPGVIKTVRLM